MNFIKIINFTEISSLHWWKEASKIITLSILKSTKPISKISGKTSIV